MDEEASTIWTEDQLREQLKALLEDVEPLKQEDAEWKEYPRIRDYIKELYAVLDVNLEDLSIQVRDLQENNRVIFWVPTCELVKGFTRVDG